MIEFTSGSLHNLNVILRVSKAEENTISNIYVYLEQYQGMTLKSKITACEKCIVLTGIDKRYDLPVSMPIVSTPTEYSVRICIGDKTILCNKVLVVPAQEDNMVTPDFELKDIIGH